MRLAALMICLCTAGGLELSACPRLSRRCIVTGSLLLPLSATAAEPEPAKVCDDACMDERVRRKQELLKKQDRKSKADAKVLFGADFQAGKRTSTKAEAKIPVLGEFLLPTDVGGVNLGSGGGASPPR